MSRGFINVTRGMFDHPIFAPEPYTEREAWQWLIEQAVWRDTTAMVGRYRIALRRGQCAFSMRFLAVKWKWSEGAVRRFLDKIRTDGMTEQRATRQATIITICNYDKYQNGRQTSDEQTDEPSDEPSDAKKKKLNNKQEEGSSGVVKIYEYESPSFRLTEKDFANWKASFAYIDIRAELLAMEGWIATLEPGRRYHAVVNALNKKNGKIKLERDKPPNPKDDWRNPLAGVR